MYFIPTWSFPILDSLTPNPKKIDFGGWCGKKNTRVAFAVPDISDGLEWKKAFKKHVKKAVKTVRKRSGVKKSVLEWK